MKDIILECIGRIILRKTERNIVPTEATELELKHEIMDRVYRQLDAMIADGSVIVSGKTLNKDKLLKLKL